jgi:pimeloyl-ACP methyl ester carboxylesterase
MTRKSNIIPSGLTAFVLVVGLVGSFSEARGEVPQAKSLRAVTVINFMGGPPGVLEAVLRTGVPIGAFIKIECRDVGPACQQLAAIAAQTDAPIVLTGWSRGGRVAMALTAMSKSEASGLKGRIKGQLLFAPEVKTQHSAWKKTFNQPLPDRQTVLAQAWGLGRAGEDVQQIDEHAQETNICVPTRIFAGRRDYMVSCHYQEQVASEPSNTGVRAFIAPDDDHFAVGGRTLELITEQARELLQAVAAGKAPESVPADKRVTSY